MDVILLGACPLFADEKRFHCFDWGCINVTERFGPLESPDRVLPSTLGDDLFDFQTVYLGSQQETPIVFDPGATIGLSPIAKDFVAWGPPEKWRGINISGISSSTEVKGSGIIEWLIRDDAGQTYPVRTQVFYIPEAKVR